MSFGIAIESAEELRAFARSPFRHDFNLLSLSGVLLGFSALAELLDKLRPARLEFHDLLPRRICGIIHDEDVPIRHEFSRSFHRSCRAAANFGASAVELGFDPDPMRGEADFELLRGLYGVLYDTGMKLRFPWRLPAVSGPSEPEAVLGFLRKLMFDASVAVEFHLHEPAAAKIDPAALLAPLFPASDAPVRLFYEPQLGNRPGRRALAKLRGALGEDHCIIFHGAGCGAELFESELAQLADLMKEQPAPQAEEEEEASLCSNSE